MALTGKTVEERVWNYLYSKIGNKYGVAGLMGNIRAESGTIFNRVEILCLKRLKENGKTYTDATYTSAVDNGKITRAEFLNPLPGKQYGYGICQWTSPSRKAGLYDLCKSRKVSIADEQASLDFLLKELQTSYSSTFRTLKSARSVKEASDVVLKKFECPADTSTAVQNTRAKYGQQIYDKYAKVSTGGVTAMSFDISKVISIAEAEIGYLEKKSNNNLDSKTANAGKNNYTKYWRDMANLGVGNYQGSYWCACFVHWCFYKAYGLKASQSLLLQNFFINCQTMYNIASSKKQIYSTPKVGDVVLFWTSSTGEYGHTGIVVGVSSNGKSFTTIEGNTSGGSTVISNGGGVAEKTYTLANLSKPKFMRPNYSTTSNTSNTYNKTEKWIGIVTAEKLNVRTGAGTNFDTCTFSPLKKGTEVSVCDSTKASKGTTWYYIKYKGKYGFVSSNFIDKKTTSSTKNEIATNDPSSYAESLAGKYVATSNLNIRNGAGTDKPIMVTIPEGTVVHNYGCYTKVSEKKWLYIQFTYQNITYTGFASSVYLKKVK